MEEKGEGKGKEGWIVVKERGRGTGEREGRRRGLGQWRAEVGSELVDILGEGCSLARSAGWVRERVRERDGFHGNGKKKRKKKNRELIYVHSF